MSKPSYDRLLAGLAGSVANVPAFAASIASLSLGGNVFFVDSVNGSDTANDGKSLATAYKTIAVAVAAAVAYDTIVIRGSFSEAVTIAVAKTGLRIVGLGNSQSDARWTAAADAVCLTINAASVLVQNIRFAPPAYAANRATSAITLGGASYARIMGCRFQGKAGSQAAIYSPVCDSDNVEISDCEFHYMNTATYGAGILGVETGGLNYSAWKIVRNIFASCVTAINLAARVCRLECNTICEYGDNAAGAVAAVLALGIDLSGTNSGGNAVWDNQLGGTYSATLYKVGASGDQWAGNMNVISGGVTAANPS